MTQIDVSKPLELSDGTPVTYRHMSGEHIVVRDPDGESRYFSIKGRHEFGKLPNLRNRQEPQSTDPKLVERMVSLLRNVAEGYGPLPSLEARDILREIDGPKTDEEWAKQIGQEAGWACNDTSPSSMLSVLMRGIAKGRELEREARF